MQQLRGLTSKKTMTHFNQIKRIENLPTTIARQIQEKIVSGKLKPGDRLPTETELADSFGVSRTVVREAIAQLRHEGMVETRQGVGAFVTEPERRRFIRIDDIALQDPESFRSLFQLRNVLEVEAAGLAALNYTAVDLEKVDDALNRMINADIWSEDGVEADLDFHYALASATGNEYFPVFIGFISEKISHAINAARAQAVRDEIIKVTIAEHVAVRDAVASRDIEAARHAMEIHILGGAQRVNLPVKRNEQLFRD